MFAEWFPKEGDIGRGHLDRFMELETLTPVILTTSQLLTTGIDAPMVKNIVLFKVINSIVDFKQIIGRGTRVREDYGKLFFTILDYTGSATRLFADTDFDGEPARITQEDLNTPIPEKPVRTVPKVQRLRPEYPNPRKYYVDGHYVEIVTGS